MRWVCLAKNHVQVAVRPWALCAEVLEMTPREQFAQQALALSTADRAYVADLLEESLIDAESATAEVDEAWSAELDRRLAEFDRGEAQAVDGEVAIQQIRERLARYRQSRGNQ